MTSTPAPMSDVPSTAGPILLVVAAAIEARAILRGIAPAISDTTALQWNPGEISPGVHLVLTGVGKSNAAAAIALALQRGPYHTVISIGIAGALPNSSLKLGDAVLASASIYADEGLQTPDRFQTCTDMGFPLGPFEGNAVPGDLQLRKRFSPFVQHVGPIATVSTCSGQNALALAVQQRTGAIAECMEGAAVGHVCSTWSSLHLQPIAFAELRVISNTTGDRGTQHWNMKLALERLSELARAFLT
jgi:futalosine hydrolase